MVVFKNFRPRVIAITAMGMDAETVNPAFKARYTVEAPNMIPKILPVIIALTVNSLTFSSGATKGLKIFFSSNIEGNLKVRHYQDGLDETITRFSNIFKNPKYNLCLKYRAI